MATRGKDSQNDGISSSRAEAWESLFAALDANPQAFFLFDANLQTLAINKSALRLSSLLTGNELAISEPFLNAFPPGSHSQLLHAIQTGLQGSHSTLDYEFSTDKGVITCGFTFSPVKLPRGSLRAILCVVVEKSWSDLRIPGPRSEQDDLTARTAERFAALEETNRRLRQEIAEHLDNETALQASESFFRLNFDSLPDPTLVWGKDPEGEIRLLTANKAAAGLNGSRLQDLVGLPLEEYYSNSMSFINLVQDTFTSGDIRKVELLFRSRFTREEKWVLCDFIRVSERNVLNILRDISQEKQRQQVDEDSRRQIELLRQAMTAFTAVLDLDQVNKNILEYLQKLIPHDNALLFLAEGGELHVRATSGFSREEDPLDQVIPTHNPQFEAINRNRMPLFLTDAQAYRPFETLGPLNCGRSWLGIPLVGHAQIMGYLSVYAKQPGMYGSEHTRLAEIFASEASIAIENANLFEQVQQLAVTDELTGFYNRRYFYELVELELARSRRYHHPVSLLMIDIDHFKAVNDQYGHATGDRVLKEICNSMRRMVRESDIPGRHGGEEFVILLPETPRDRAADVAERLRQAVAAEPLTVDEYEISVTLSIGVTEFADSKQDLDTFLRQADQAMYSAKQAGRNRVSIWHDTPEG